MEAYRDILAQHQLYAVGLPDLLEGLPRSTLGVPLEADHRIDPLRVSSAPFLRLVERLDALAYGPRELTMPRWAFYDCAELPGAVIGFGRAASELTPHVRRVLGIAKDHVGLVPLSMALFVPMLEEGHWLGFALCDLHEVAPGATPAGLRLLSMAVALDLLGARRFTGTTQWASPNLRVHARFAPLRVHAAWVPAHSKPATCTFGFDVTPAVLQRALREVWGPADPEATLFDLDDRTALQGLQQEIEDGGLISIVGPPEERGAFVGAPIRRGKLA
ncbi:MAG: hypothetical protein JRH16_21765 [Deltaproteobacteria bacterium]|nr:hypothetical protein [Deltaproteobacteria bacterium]